MADVDLGGVVPDDNGEPQTPPVSPTGNEGGQGETITPEIKPTEAPVPPAEPPVEPEPKVEGTEGKPEPFHKDPAFQERIQEIEDKYGNKATNWETINKLAASDPDFYLTIVKKYEASGLIEKGSYEKEKTRLQPAEPTPNIDNQPSTEKPTEEDSKVKSLLDSNPDIQFARKQREEAEKRVEEENNQKEAFLQEFEKKHPEIAKSSNPLIVRKQIFIEATKLQSENKELSFEQAMESAAKWTLHRDKVLEEYKEKGVVEGVIQNVQEGTLPGSAGAAPSGGGSRPLTDEEKIAKQQMGAKTDEEYLKFLDPDSGMVDDK